MKSVLVTGATGFIGRHCLPFLLQENFEVHAVFSRTKPLDLYGIYWHQANLLESGQPEKIIERISPTHLLHLAWIATPGVYASSLSNLDWVRSSLELLQAFAATGGQRVVMAGTCFEYDWEYGYCREHNTVLKPSTMYGTCKHAVQLLLQQYTDNTGLSSAWGRIFFLYGPYEHPDRLVSSVIRSLLKDEEALCTSGTQIRDFLHVEDVGKAFVALLSSDINGPVNIASGNPVAIKDLISCIAKKLNKQDLVKLGALVSRYNEPHLLIADVSRLHDELKFYPIYNIHSGLNNAIEWWKKYLKL